MKITLTRHIKGDHLPSGEERIEERFIHAIRLQATVLALYSEGECIAKRTSAFLTTKFKTSDGELWDWIIIEDDNEGDGLYLSGLLRMSNYPDGFTQADHNRAFDKKTAQDDCSKLFDD